MDRIPHHILIEIFSYLDSANLLASSRVCQLWADLIKSTPTIMKIFTMRITSNRTKELIEITDQLPCGRHENLEIIDFFGDFLILKQILFVHQLTLSCIRIVRPAMWRAKLFTESFNVLSNLRNLTLENCQFRDCNEIGENEEKFMTLRHLTIVNCNYEIFDIFKGCNLLSLTVEYTPSYTSATPTTMKHLTDLLNNLSSIQCLTLLGVTEFPKNFLSINHEFKFELENLIIDNVEGEHVNEDSVIEFLNKQKEHLKELAISKHPDSIRLSKLINDVQLIAN